MFGKNMITHGNASQKGVRKKIIAFVDCDNLSGFGSDFYAAAYTVLTSIKKSQMSQCGG